MKKIVRVISRLNVGGPAIHTVLLSEQLNRDGFTDILVCGTISESEGDMAYYAAERKVRPVVIPELQRDIAPRRDIVAFFKLWKLMRRERPDIVHTHAAKAGALGRLAALLSGVPVKVHTFHGHIFDGYFSPMKARVFLLIERFLALFTDRVVTVSDAVRTEIVDTLRVTDGKKCVVVPLGLDLDRFLAIGAGSGAFRRSIGAAPETVLVGIVGRLVPIKNHEMFLDAAKLVLSNAPRGTVTFVVIGDGELRAHLKKCAADAGISDAVIFTGWQRDLAPVYADLDIVALTSLNEGTPVSLIEAMASGRAVIATKVGGVGDLVADGSSGDLVPSGDREAFAEKLVSLIGNGEKRRAYGRAGRERVKTTYSKERLVADIKGLYRECLA